MDVRAGECLNAETQRAAEERREDKVLLGRGKMARKWGQKYNGYRETES